VHLARPQVDLCLELGLKLELAVIVALDADRDFSRVLSLDLLPIDHAHVLPIEAAQEAMVLPGWQAVIQVDVQIWVREALIIYQFENQVLKLAHVSILEIAL